ncbi:RNA polymerase sigma factor [Planctomycetes bacterium Pla86]|uniref:RNA polymerase sigma factor n=2 Tax=Engelhardtia mirabilis TaxID=2528011 RepID=A0A518BDA0_9BACT|nr:RNA polymerase sigma factor [Planctomycetes bacterium Pla133]QDU99283.1 RNA polymerase sigma factor [Planctomycetes bacterium Pla86]
MRLFHGRMPNELRSRVDTHDLIQIGLARAAQKAAAFEPRAPGSARAWLHALLRNALTDMTREHTAQRRDVRRECRGDEVFPAIADGEKSADPEQVVERVEAWARLLLQISALKDAEREIVIRHTLEEQSFAAIAMALGISESTVKDRYARSLEHLQRLNRGHSTS